MCQLGLTCCLKRPAEECPIPIIHAVFAFHAAGSDAEDSSKYGKNCSETMTLRKEGDSWNSVTLGTFSLTK